MYRIKLKQTHRYDFINGYNYTIVDYRGKENYVYVNNQRVIYADKTKVQYSLFEILKNTLNLSWFDNSIVEALELEYYLGHSGEKSISVLFDNLLKIYNGYDYYNSYIDVNKIVYDKLSNLISNKFKDNWNKIYNSYFSSEYNPIHNYNMKETEKTNQKIITQNKSADNSEFKNSQNTNNTNDIYGFNSSDSVPSDKQSLSNNQNGSQKNNTSIDETITRNSEDNYITREKTGNIGVTTSQKMLQEELNLRKFDLITRIMNDVDLVLCSQIY